MRFQVHGHSIGVEIGFVVLCIEPYQDIAHKKRAEDVFDWNEETLVQVVAQLFQTEHVGFHLLRRDLLVHLESVLARRADRHRGEAVIVAGNASCLRNEIGVRPSEAMEYFPGSRFGSCSPAVVSELASSRPYPSRRL